MPLKIIGRNGGQLIAQSSDGKPVCRYCAWLELMDIIVGKQRCAEFVCSRHLIGAPHRTRCDLFVREPVQTTSRRYLVMCLRVFFAYTLALASLSACAEEVDVPPPPSLDALRKFDESTVGAAIVNACDASFDWKKASQLADVVGKNAYDELLNRLRTQAPADAKNEKKVDDALQSRIAENIGRGTRRLVAEKGCSDPEIQTHMRRFEAENR